MTDDFEINKKKLLAVEGKDEINFLKSYLKYLNINIKNIQLVEVGGVTKFKKALPALAKRRGFTKVEKLGIIRDADDNGEGAFQSIKNTLDRKCGLEPPETPKIFNEGGEFEPDIGIYIMPKGDSDSGMLENLCLQTVKDTSEMKCVEDFIDCIKETETPKKLEKAKVQAFLASMPEHVRNLGIGARKKYWKFSSDKLKPLKKFLENFR